jgi:hypothetical protein
MRTAAETSKAAETCRRIESVLWHRALGIFGEFPNGRIIIADDKTNRGSADRSRISMSEDYEVRYWTKELDVTREQLATAIATLGITSKPYDKSSGSKMPVTSPKHA